MSKCEFLKTLIQKKLCPTCHFGLESIKPRWHIVHSQNSNAMAIWNYQKNWKPKFSFIWCNLWNEPKQSMFSYFVEWNVVTKSLIRNALCIIFVPCFLQYTLYTLMVFNEWQNGISSAFTTIGKSWRMTCAPNSPNHYQDDY